MRLLALVLIALISCRSAVQKSAQVDPLSTLVSKELGDKSIISKNESGTFALAYHQQNRSVRYIIVRMSDNQVVRKESIRGSVSWDADMRIKESLMPGMVKRDSKPGDNIRIIDLNKYVTQIK